MPERISINSFIPALRNLAFLLLVLLVDTGVIFSTIYIESGGAKLALPNLKWPKEIIALFELIGVPSTYFTPATVLGAASSLLLFIGTYLIIHYLLAIIGTIQKILPRIARGKEKLGGIEELYSLLQPVIVIMIVGVLLHGALFNIWMKPLAQLQVARTFWPSDFRPVVQGDTIQAIREVTPDVNTILDKHKGEFLKAIVIHFPFVILLMHLLASVLSEMFLLHTLMTMGSFEARNIEVITRIRWGLMELYHRGITTLANIALYIRRLRVRQAESPHPALGSETVRQAPSAPVPEDTPPNAGLHQQPGAQQTVQTEEANVTQDNAGETIPPEEQPVRVLGGGEAITPAAAMLYPEIYVVEKEGDGEPGMVSYRIYTRDFYETLQKQERS
jgi:hypothetical protein